MNDELQALTRQVTADPDWYARRRAARLLSRFPGEETKRTLLKVLGQEPDGDVIQAAILTLAKLGVKEMIEFITKPKIMMSPQESVRWACSHALGLVGSVWNFEHLYHFVNDVEWNVRNETISTLERLIKRIGHDGSGEVATLENKVLLLVRMLQIDNQGLQESIIEQLVQSDSKLAEPLLIERLTTENECIKLGLVKSLGRMKSKNSVESLIRMLSDESLRTRLSATEALGEIGGPLALNSLVAHLGDPNESVIKAAIAGIIKQRNFEFIEAILIDSLKNDSSARAKKSILFVMGEIRRDSFIDPILENLGNSYFLVRRTATEALVKFGEPIRKEVNSLMILNGLPIEKLIAEAENGSTFLMRANAIKALGMLKDPEALHCVGRLSQDSNSKIAGASEEAYRQINESIWARAGAAFILGELGGKKSIAPLLTALNSVSSRIRRAAISALRKIKSEDTIEQISKVALTEEHSEIRREAVRALAEIEVFSESVKEVLFQTMVDSSYPVRLETSRVLGKIHDRRSIELLLASFQDYSFEVRRNALNALYSTGKDVTHQASDLLSKTGNDNVKIGIFQLLAMLQAVETIPTIEAVLASETDRNVLCHGRQALGILNGTIDNRKISFV